MVLSVVAASTLPICESFICSPPCRRWGAKTIAQWQYSGKVVQPAFIFKGTEDETRSVRKSQASHSGIENLEGRMTCRRSLAREVVERIRPLFGYRSEE